MAHIQYVDGLVREFLIFRGFSNSLKTFESELKVDKDKGFRADKIVDSIQTAINTQDLQSIRDIWSHLDTHLFTKLEQTFTSAINKLENGILKLYVITAYSSNKPDKVTEFFTKMSTELNNHSEWKEWFFFPFCKSPEDHPTFRICFSKQWQDTLILSLHNFLLTIYQCMPQPTLSRVGGEQFLVKKLQDENEALRSRIQQISQQSNVQQSASGNTSHQSRQSTFYDQKQKKQTRTNSTPRNLNDVVPFEIPPPAHIVDDFYIIAQENANLTHNADSQTRGLRSLIRNISSSGSPVLGRKESMDRNKNRSGSVGSGNLKSRQIN